MTDKVDRRAEQEAALATKLKRTRDERLREEARLATRRAELVGKVVLKQVKEGKLGEAWLRELLDESLARKADRTLFNLNRVAEDERTPEPDELVRETVTESLGKIADGSGGETGFAIPLER